MSGRSRTREPLSPIDKQFYYQVKYGRKVTFSTPIEDITGYLAGWDRYAWFVLQVEDGGEVRLRLVYKGAGMPLELHTEPTYDNEPADVLSQLRPIIGPFRTKLLDEYGNSTSPRAASN